MKTVILFDVDGTLITTGGAGRRAIQRALEKIGVPDCASFSFAGMTDRLIIRTALQNAAEPISEERIDHIIEAYLGVLEDEVAIAPADRYRVHRGMVEALDACAARADCAVGLGTGNVERGARIKLERVALSQRFSFGGFGCDAEDRAELIRVGAERGAALLGVARSSCRVVVVGDTPRDVAAAKAIGAESVAVATGVIGKDELAAAGPTHLFDDLASPGALDRLLG